MRPWFGFLAFCFLLLPLSALPGQEKNPHVAATPPLTPEEQLKTFHLPPGFVIELVAVEPKIKKPINIAFDALGRLWVTESVEYPFPAPEDKKPKDTVKVLSDFAPDGRARKIVTFADGVNIPIGVLPLPNGKSALIYSIPNIYRMTDTDGDGAADQRDVLYGSYGFGDTHGMTGEFMWGFDGWIYCCHGFANTSKVKSKGDTAITMQSGNTYRIKADGSRIEQFTWGQVNPFGLAFDPLGNLYSCDCHSRPLYQLLRGAYYPSFGKPHDGLGFGPEMVTHDHGSTAIAGIAYYAADQYPAEFRDNVYIGNVITNRINRDRIDWKGGTPKGVEMPDFVKCDDPWFRPVDIKLGPDGCLYVADFYNRIIGHYEVPLTHPGRDRERGRIWRIVYRGPDGKGQSQPVRDLGKADFTQLIDEMASPNITVRMHAANLLVEKGKKDIDLRIEIKQAMRSAAGTQKAHCLWVLARLGNLPETELQAAAADKENMVRVHAYKILAEREELTPALQQLALAGLRDPSALVQRAAAEALSRHADPMNLDYLLEVRQLIPPADTHLTHVVRMALRDQFRKPEIWSKLVTVHWDDSDHRAVAHACLGVGDESSASFVLKHLQRRNEPTPMFLRQAHYAVRYGPPDAAKAVLAFVQTKHPKDLSLQAGTLKSVQQAAQERNSPLSKNELDYAANLCSKLLASTEGSHFQIGAELAGSFRVAESQPALLAAVRRGDLSEDARKKSVTALLTIAAAANVVPLAELLNAADAPIGLREHTAYGLAGTNLPEAHAVLVKTLEAAPARLQTIVAVGLASSKAGGEMLLDAVEKGKASARLLQERPIELRLKQAKLSNLDARLARLTKGLPAADQRLQELLGKRRASFQSAKADPQEGLKLFQKHCAACHQIANQGAKIGPQLDGIGVRGLDRLLEDTLDPNRNVDQAFRATSLELKNGQVMIGLLLRKDGNVLVMADNQGKEVRVSESDIAERVVAQLSPMPGNFTELMSEPEFNHLLAYLLEQRVK